MPSLPQPPHECNNTVTSRFLEGETTTEANNSINGSLVCFAATCIRCAIVIFSLNVAIPTVPPTNNSTATENGMSAGGLEGSSLIKQKPICCHFDSIVQCMHELLLLCAWSSSPWDMPFLCMELEPLGRVFSLHGARARARATGTVFSLHGARATGTYLFSAWSSSHWDVPFLCMELEPLGLAFSLHGARATGMCLFSETYAR